MSVLPKNPLAVYYQSWSANWSSSVSNFDLSKIPDSINIVILSFVNPNCSYVSGSNSWTGTGLDFSSDFNIVKGAIQLLQKRNVIVMIAVGGATYPFTIFNHSNIASLVKDLGVNGVDIDWEPANGCADSDKLGPIIQKMKSSLPKGILLSLAGFSVGCYGATELPQSINTGMNIAGLKSNGKDLDFINIMSYDASNVYNPLEAFKAYRKYYSGTLLLGAEVPPEAWGGHVITLQEVESYAKCVMNDSSSNGIFVWSYQKSGTPSCMDILNCAKQVFSKIPTPSPVNPTPTPVNPTPTPVNPTPIPVNPTPIPVNPTPIPVNPTPIPVNPIPVPNSVNIENWVKDKLYTKNQIVFYNNTKYICTTDILSCTPDKNPWSLLESNWSTGINYTVGQVVNFNGKVYKCLQSHSSILEWSPEKTPSLWN